MQTFRIANLDVRAVKASAGRICYVLYPFDCLAEWMQAASETFGVSIAVITGMDWNDDLTPWPAAGEPPGSPDFKGLAPEFLATLTGKVLPEVERGLGISADVERTLAGVSLSGLFTLWQWVGNDTFRNIISLSGSFWYSGFVEWLKARPLPDKSGRAYFLLGNQETKTNVKAFRPVQRNTEEIVRYLHDKGVNDYFELVPGNHYQNGEDRITRAFRRMFGSETDGWK